MNPPTLFDVAPNYVGRFRHSDPGTSEAAAKQLTGRVDREIFYLLRVTGRALTNDEIATELRLHAPTCRSALSRLERDGHVVRAGEGVSARGNRCGKFKAAAA